MPENDLLKSLEESLEEMKELMASTSPEEVAKGILAMNAIEGAEAFITVQALKKLLDELLGERDA